MKKVIVCSPHKSHKDFNFPRFEKSVRIRFGAVKKYPKKDIDFPSPKAISLAKDKVKMKRAFRKAGVSSPKFMVNNFINRLLYRFKIIQNNAFFFKERFHSKGIGMVFCYRGGKLLNQGEGYFEEFAPSYREFRVHVCDGKAFHVDEKIPREEGHISTIKNLSNGYKYRECKTDVRLDLIKESVKAVNCLGLEFGAADVGIGLDGVISVFEVNTAVGMRTYLKNKYEKELINLINNKINK